MYHLSILHLSLLCVSAQWVCSRRAWSWATIHAVPSKFPAWSSAHCCKSKIKLCWCLCTGLCAGLKLLFFSFLKRQIVFSLTHFSFNLNLYILVTCLLYYCDLFIWINAWITSLPLVFTVLVQWKDYSCAFLLPVCWCPQFGRQWQSAAATPPVKSHRLC